MHLLILGLCLTIVNVALFFLAFFFIIPREKKSYFDKLMAWRRVNNVAKLLIRNSEVERFLVLMLTNGGGDPHPGAKLYATAVVNELNNINSHRSIDYDRIEVDNDYIERLIRARAAGKQVMETEYMQEGLLKRLYEAEKVRYSEMYYLFSTENEMFFCTAATYSAEHLQGSQGDISLAVNEIKKTLSAVYPEVKAYRFKRLRWE